MRSRIFSDPGKYILGAPSALLTVPRRVGRTTVACARTKLLLPSATASNVWLAESILDCVNDGEITGMYAQLIEQNEKMPDPRAGSTPVLSGASVAPPVQVHAVDLPSSIRRRLPRLSERHSSPAAGCPHRAG